MSNEDMPVVLDREVSSLEHDAFGHRHFADALRSIIEAPDLSPPFSVGLLGGWGSGKSTIKAMYLRRLLDDATGRRKSIYTVTFNAWRYSENVKRALLRQVYLAIGGSEETLTERLFREVRKTSLAPRRFGDVIRETARAWAAPITVVFLIIALLFAATWLLLGFVDLSPEFRAGLSLIVATVSSGLVSKVRLVTVAGTEPLTTVQLPHTGAEEFQAMLLRQLVLFKAGKTDLPEAKNCERLVVFVDDLDRLSPEEMVQGLDAVRTFMEIPPEELPGGIGLVFVISCDEERIAHALERNQRNPELPASVFNRSDARRYLDRIFQFRLEIPPFPRRDMRDYARAKLEGLRLPGLSATPAAIVDTMIHVGVRSPRNALQIVNAFAQSYWIAYRREKIEAGTVRAGGLHDGAVTNHAKSLAALSALRVDFPGFYGDVLQHPDLIGRFSDVAFGREKLSALPRATQQALSRYFEKTENGGEPAVVRSVSRRLRRFLASLQGHRWPKSLEPLLVLSEDAISRKFGDGKVDLFESLVSGDQAGVLEALGRAADSRPISTEDAVLLRDMMEDIGAGAESRKILAAGVLAELVDRFPADHLQALTTPIVRQLEQSLEFRSRLGIRRIRVLVGKAESPDQRAVARELVLDALNLQEPVRLSLQSGEPPGLDESLVMAKEAIECVLEIRRRHQLDETTDSRVRDWLADRTVTAAGGGTGTVPFTELHRWVAQDPDELLGLLGHRYSDVLVSQLEARSLPDFDVTQALEFAVRVFDVLRESGEESRVILWAQLERIAAVKDGSAAGLAWDTLLAAGSLPDATSFSRIIGAICVRLGKEMGEQEVWELNWQAGATTTLALIEGRAEDVSDEALEDLKDLVLLWGDVEQTAEFAVRGLKRLGPDLADVVLEKWCAAILELELSLVRDIAARFESLGKPQVGVVVTQLNVAVSEVEVSTEEASRYQAFVEGLSAASFAMPQVQSHLDTFFLQVANNHANPKDYLSKLFPAAVVAMSHAKPATVGNMLHALFANAKKQPKHYAWLHSQMVAHWPKKTRDHGSYDPATIFSESVQFARSQTMHATAGLLASMRDMLDRGLVPETSEESFSASACQVWAKQPHEAADAVGKTRVAPPTKDIAELADPIDWESADDTEPLAVAWKHFGAQLDDAGRLEVTRHVLHAGPRGKDDGALRLWLGNSGELPGLMRDAFADEMNSDEHRSRLWSVVLNEGESLGPDEVRATLRNELLRPGNQQTVQEIVRSESELSKVFNTRGLEAELAKELLLSVFADAPTVATKGEVARWAHNLGAQSLLKSIPVGKLTMDDVELLEAHFGSRPTRPLRSAVAKSEKAGK